MTDADCFVFNADFTRREKICTKFLLIQQISKLDDLLMSLVTLTTRHWITQVTCWYRFWTACRGPRLSDLPKMWHNWTFYHHVLGNIQPWLDFRLLSSSHNSPLTRFQTPENKPCSWVCSPDCPREVGYSLNYESVFSCFCFCRKSRKPTTYQCSFSQVLVD